MKHPYFYRFTTQRRYTAMAAFFLVAQATMSWAQTAPNVVSWSPPQNAAAIRRPVPVAATFSQPLDVASVSRTSMRVFSEQRGGQLAGTYSGGGTSTVGFTPAQRLNAGETVRTSFTTALRSVAGPALATPVISQFTADAAPAAGTFAAGATDFQLGTNPAGIVATDLDGDGILDVATADRGGTINYAFGDGTGRYSGGVSLGFGGTYTAILAADLNGDGAMDLVAPRVRTASVVVISNNGTGRAGFGSSPTTSVAVDNDARQAAAADIDGDGDLDLLVTCYSGTVAIRFNNGRGVFSGTTSVPLNTAYGIAPGDVDNDGDVDFVATDYDNQRMAVWLNNGRGVFAAGPTIAVGSGPARVALGDVNGDGYLDAFAANLTGQTVSVALNTGTGTFGAPATVAARNAAEIALGDVDGDGDLDFVVSDYSFGSQAVGVSVRLNNGQGSFSGTGTVGVAGSATTGQANNYPFGVALADVDGNGTLDLLAATFNQTSVRLNAFAPALLTSSTAAVCTGSNSGTLTLTRMYGTLVKYQADTGTGFLDVAGNNPSATLSFSNLATTTSYRAVLLTPEGNTVYSTSATVVVNPLPAATIAANGPATFCQGGSVRLTAGGGGTYRWSTGATTTSITASTSGTYAVTVTSAAGCVATAIIVVTVNPATSAAFAYNAPAYCVSGPNPTPVVTGTPGGMFASSTGLALDATTGAIDLAASTPGTYAVTYRVGGPCPSAATAAVTLAAPPVAMFAYTPATGGAGGAAMVLPALGPGATAGTFAAAPGLTLNPATGAITLSSSIAGTYVVTNTVPGPTGCAATTATAAFTVTPRPAPPVLTARYNGATTTLTSSAPIGNQFYLNNAAIPGAVAQTYVVNGAPAELGSYTVTVTDANGGVSFPSAPLVVTASVRPVAGTGLRVYPNPTPDGRLVIELTGYRHASEVSVVNAVGQVVCSAAFPASAGLATHALDLTKLAAGMYLVRVTTEGGLDTRRVVKE